MKLLSNNQQALIIHIFEKQFLEKEGMMTREIRQKGIYKNHTSLYFSLNYLQSSGLIKIKQSKKRKNFYYLTLKGEILARVLATLPDVPDNLKRKAYLF